MKLRYIAFLIVVCTLLGGCASKKKVATDTTTKTTKTTRKASIQERTIAAQPDFTSVLAQKAKLSINYQQRQISASATISLIRDSIFIMSVQPLLGIELVRLEVTPDEVVMIDKLNHRYVQLTMAELQQKTGLPVGFSDVQAIAMDRLFCVGKPQSFFQGKDFENESKNAQTVFSFQDKPLRYTYLIDEATLALLQSTFAFTGRAEQVDVRYQGHTLRDNVLFPNLISVAYTGGRLEASGTITLPNIVFNGKVNAARANLRSYTKTDITTILTGK